MAHLLGAENIALRYPTRQVFDSVTLGISEGDRIGIVGRNGDGKSSLLALLTGSLEPNSGRVTRRGGIRFGVLSQQDNLDYDLTVAENIVGQTPEHEWAGDARARDIIAGLVLDLDWHGGVARLSGGQKRRVALAALLVQEWDILALDEPTNHLDVEAIAWLAEHLKKRWPKNQGALLVITHDRWFLDEVCNTTWEVHDGIVEPFEGGYAAYVLQRLERDRIRQSTEQKKQNLLRKELAWLRRGAPARTSKPKFRIDAANALITDVPPVRDQIKLQRMAISRLGKEVVRLNDVSAAFAGDTAQDTQGADKSAKTVLKNITWDLAPGERTGILGPNGAGKSTLLSIISGSLTPTSGRVKHGKTVQIATLDQSFSQLREIGGDRVREVLARTKTTFEVDGKELTPSQLLERLGFRQEQLSTPVADLSGGQKRRLQLLLILMAEPNVLILDEPTNDVDADMLAAMEDLLDSWPGTLIVVSHDRYLLERVTDQQYAIIDGSLRHLPRGVEEYLELRSRQLSASSNADAQKAADPPPAAKDTALAGAARRGVEKEVAALGRKIEKLTAQITAAESALAQIDPLDYESLTERGAAVQLMRDELELAEDKWLELSDRLEE